jgi:hypothetical protein
VLNASALEQKWILVFSFEMKGLRVAAVITVSEQGEDLSVGLASVLKLRAYFTELHVVYPKDYASEINRGALPGDFPYYAHHEELTIAKLSNALLVVHVNPAHNIDEPALLQLLENAMEKKRTCDHFAVRGTVDCGKERRTYLLGFVWFVAYMDWFRTWLNCWGYHLADDLRASKVVPEFPTGCSVPAYRHAWLFAVWSRVAAVRYSPQSLSISPLARLTSSLYTHPHMSVWNMTWWLTFIVYYICFALPWWNLYFENVAYTQLYVRPSLYTAWSWIMWRNVFHPVWLALWGIQIVLCMWIVARRYKHASLGWVFLMPFYVTLSPLVWVSVRGGWIK